MRGYDTVFTVEEVATRLKKSKAYVYQLIREGKLKTYNLSYGIKPRYVIRETDYRKYAGLAK